MQKFLSLVLFSLLVVSCAKSEEVTTEEAKTNAEILELSFDLYSKMKKENQDLVMNLSLNKEGKIVAKYKKSTNELAAKTSPELLCEDETYSKEFADCVKENVEAGICVSVTTCAYCAHECIDSQ